MKTYCLTQAAFLEVTDLQIIASVAGRSSRILHPQANV
jgi:hypothetical protein